MKLSQMRHYCIYWQLGVSYPTEQEKAGKEEGKGFGWVERERRGREEKQVLPPECHQCLPVAPASGTCAIPAQDASVECWDRPELNWLLTHIPEVSNEGRSAQGHSKKFMRRYLRWHIHPPVESCQERHRATSGQQPSHSSSQKHLGKETPATWACPAFLVQTAAILERFWCCSSTLSPSPTQADKPTQPISCMPLLSLTSPLLCFRLCCL